jgi:hypothetical protein
MKSIKLRRTSILRHSEATKRSAGETGIQQSDSRFAIIGLRPMISPHT